MLLASPSADRALEERPDLGRESGHRFLVVRRRGAHDEVAVAQLDERRDAVGRRSIDVDRRAANLRMFLRNRQTQTQHGRLRRRYEVAGCNRTKFIAYGAGAGFLISTLTGGGSLKGALIGALGGLAYGELTKNKSNNREVTLRPGTEFGVRLDQRLALAGNWDSYTPIPARARPTTR